MIKKFSLILAILCAISSIAFAETDTDTTSGDSLYAKNMLKNHKPYVYSAVDLTCRELKDKNLKTQIVDFDIEKGITYCQIYKKANPEFILSTNADAQWLLYRKTENKQLEKEKAVTKIQSMSSSIGKNTGNSSSGDTLSTFLVKTVLLMGNSGGSKGTNVTEYDATSFKDTWENSSGFKETAINLLGTIGENIAAPVKWVASKFGAETEVSKRKLEVPLCSHSF